MRYGYVECPSRTTCICNKGEARHTTSGCRFQTRCLTDHQRVRITTRAHSFCQRGPGYCVSRDGSAITPAGTAPVNLTCQPYQPNYFAASASEIPRCELPATILHRRRDPGRRI